MQFGNGFIPTNFQNDNFIPKEQQQEQAKQEIVKLLRKTKTCFITFFFLYPLLSILEIILYLFTDAYSVVFLFTSYFLIPFHLFFWIFINKILKPDFQGQTNKKLLKIFRKFFIAYLTVNICITIMLLLNYSIIATTTFSLQPYFLGMMFVAFFLLLLCIPISCFNRISQQILLLFPKNKKESKRTIPVKTYNNLIDKTGKRFFVKYYYQLKNWATYDLIEIIEENISANEKEKRILYGKKIFNSNLNIYALEQIIYNSENKIDQNTIIKAKEIYKEERLIK